MTFLNNNPRLKQTLQIGLVFILSTLIWFLLNSYFGNDYSREEHVQRALIVFFTVVPMVLFIWHLLDRKPISKLGIIPSKSHLRFLMVGVLFWLLPALASAIVLVASGYVSIKTAVPASEIFLTLLLLIVLVFIYEAFTEELIFRGYIYDKLLNLVSPQAAVVIQSILFTLWGHLNGGENSLDRAVLFFSFSMVVGSLRHVTGNIWAGVGFHLAFQVVAQLTGSVGAQFQIQGLETLMLIGFVLVPFVATGFVNSMRYLPDSQ